MPSRRDLFVTGPGPDGSGSKPELPEGWAHTPEKSGIDAAPGLGFCANAADNNSVMAAVVETMISRMMWAHSSRPKA
jgi:hypothetical protein